MPRAVVQPRALPVPITVAAGSVFSHAGSSGGELLPPHAATTHAYQALFGTLISGRIYTFRTNAEKQTA